MDFVEVPEETWPAFLRGLLVYVAMELDKEDAAECTLFCECVSCGHEAVVSTRSLVVVVNALAPCLGSRRVCSSLRVRSPVGPGSLLARACDGEFECISTLVFPSGLTVFELGPALVRSGGGPIPTSKFRGYRCSGCGEP
jgi:hypothetical protein